jgi:hypothetical protein
VNPPWRIIGIIAAIVMPRRAIAFEAFPGAAAGAGPA